MKKYREGFTLVELLVILALIGLTGLVSVPFYTRFFTQNAVSNTYDQLLSQLRRSQTYAIAGKQNGPWGVHNGGTQLVLFQGSSYAGRNTGFDEKFSVNSNITVSGFTDIIFAQVTGLPNSSATITIQGINITRTITITAQGIINAGIAPTSTPTPTLPPGVTPTSTPTPTPTSTPTPTLTPTPTPTPAAIALDAVSHITLGSISSTSWSHTITSHPNNFLLVGISIYNSSHTATVTNVTYNGVGMTQLATANCAGSQCRDEVWYLKSSQLPPTGTYPVTVNLSTSGEAIVAGALSFYNVDQTTPFGTPVTSAANSNHGTVTVPSNTTQLVVGFFANGGSLWTSDSGQTSYWLEDLQYNTGASASKSGGANSGTSSTIGWTLTNTSSDPWAAIGVALNP